MFEKLQRAVATTARTGLHALHSAVTSANLTGHLDDTEAELLFEKIQQRYRSKFDPKPRRKRGPTPVEVMLNRRRLANTGPLPPTLAAFFTTAELAVLAVLAMNGGTLTVSVCEFAKRAGVGHSTVQKALRAAERMGLISIEERRVAGNKNLPNVVRVISKDWKAWIMRGGSKKLKPLDTRFINSCKSMASIPHTPAWKRLISRSSPGPFGIRSPQQR